MPDREPLNPPSFGEDAPAGEAAASASAKAAPAGGTPVSAGEAAASAGGASAPAGAAPASRRKRNLVVLIVLGAAWLVFDRATKSFFDDGSFALGEHVAGPFLGLFRFTLVHNTGGAWGIFDDSTFALGVVSLLVVAALVAFLLWDAQASLGQAIGIALVAAGGIGNAFDRFALGYVVDFIDLSFIDFPVFNIADIGVTCGLVLTIVSMLVSSGRERA